MERKTFIIERSINRLANDIKQSESQKKTTINIKAYTFFYTANMSFFNRLFKFRIFVCNNTSPYILLWIQFLQKFRATLSEELDDLHSVRKIKWFFAIFIIYISIGINEFTTEFKSNTCNSTAMDEMVCYLRCSCVFSCKYFLLYALFIKRSCQSNLCIYDFYSSWNLVWIFFFI
jgi:hypothetical protein